MRSNKLILSGIKQALNSYQYLILVFFSSMFILISFAGTRLFLSDEGVILDQFYNLIHGSLALEFAKINTSKGIFILIGDNLYGMFSYSILILSLPTYYLLGLIDHFYSAHLLLMQFWAFSGGIAVYLAGKIRKSKNAAIFGAGSFLLLIFANLFFLKPIYFPKWGEIISIQFTNILITSIAVVVVYLLFKNFFSNQIALFASFFIILATPVLIYAITLKHHSLALLLTLLTIYFFYRYNDKKENKFIYLAYVSAGLCVWTRLIDGAVIMFSLLITDMIIFKRNIKYIIIISAVILISLIPFFSFNFLILGTPFSILETTPLVDRPVTLNISDDFILLEQDPINTKQTELLDKLGYTWTSNIKGDWSELFGYSLFFKLINTFGVFLVSPFLIIAIAFIIEMIKLRTKLNKIDKFLLVYIFVLFSIFWLINIFFNKNVLMSIVTDTPMVLEYRYLLILYVIFLYFALRITKINDLIYKNYKKLGLLYGIFLIINLIYFISVFPIPFLNIYYNASRLTAFSLILLVSLDIFTQDKKSMLSINDNILLLFIALALAEASMFVFFYYWVVSMAYISPQQNLSLIPIINNIMEWMYKTIIY